MCVQEDRISRVFTLMYRLHHSGETLLGWQKCLGTDSFVLSCGAAAAADTCQTLGWGPERDFSLNQAQHTKSLLGDVWGCFQKSAEKRLPCIPMLV